MKKHLAKHSTLARLLPAAAALLVLASTHVSAQSTTTTTTTTTSPTSTDQASPSDQQAVVLDPFTVSTSKDNGYAATNAISGSRVDTPIKDLPVPIQVITSDFINDIGATDLRSSLSYSSGIMLQSQNDLENTGSTFGSPYGPGGVNNPQGLTANIDQSQLKVRGFVTTNVLRDGFLRAVAADSVNIDRIEVVFGPNALLYGTGNFGGVVDYLTKMPEDTQHGEITFSAGLYDFYRSALDVTGPISAANHLDYRVDAAVESSDTNIDYQKSSHYFVSPSVQWKPFSGTDVYANLEYGESHQEGFGFQALRAAQGNGSTPLNSDQLEAVAFYFPPGTDPRTYNLSGPDTFDDQTQENLELKFTQRLLVQSEWTPDLDALVGYNHSRTTFNTRGISAGLFGPVTSGPGSDLAQTITTAIANDINGQQQTNLNLVNGTFPDEVTRYQWTQNDQTATRDQERVELTGRKDLWEGKWYKAEDQLLAGYSELKNDIEVTNEETDPSDYNYWAPNSTTGIHFGTQGDGTADAPMFENNPQNSTLGWDAGYYLNNYAKFLNDRIIIMDGVRWDKVDEFATNTTLSAPGASPASSAARGLTSNSKTYQNAIMIEITKHLSVYGLKAEGIEPNFNNLRNGIDGNPVGPNFAKSREIGIKFDFLDGKISGTLSHYTITKASWAAEPWFAPAPLGHPRFNPNADIVYELSGGFNAQGQPGATTLAGGVTSQGGPIQNQPGVISAWNSAVAAGAVYTLPSEPGRLYLDASKPSGAAYLDAAFAANQADGGAGWPGWLYQGDSNMDPNINNATEDAAGFYNANEGIAPAFQVLDRSKGFDGSLTYTVTKDLQLIFNFAADSSVQRLNLGQYPKYPYPQDRWAVWYFQNGTGGFGLQGLTLNQFYTNPQDTSSNVTTLGTLPGDDTPKYACDFFVHYDMSDWIRGFSFGIGGTWHSQEQFFSGITHGSGQAEGGAEYIAYSPSEFLLNVEAKYAWQNWGHKQYVQLNVDNALNDQKLYGLIYQSPLMAKISYGWAF
ncbi:MAG TPA: TonB-dependent receptor plug domain-containing protein [Opitutaceae bacterium]|jgi:outer membrane receptor protein involved in Fe transport